MERLDHYMARANAAYYANCDPFDDFTTAPELTQVFGELLGLWAGIVWQMMGQPAPVMLVEAGPGRGTLMRDALTAIGKTLPDFAAAALVHLIETSPRLRAHLAVVLPAATLLTDLATAPDGPLLLIANEFLDALPIRQFVKGATGWAERHVQDDRFIACPADIDLPDHEIGTVRECGEAAEAFVGDLADRIARDGGAALLIDYGPAESGDGDSLQAIHDGGFADPLRAAGRADLTAHVDFARLATIAREHGCEVAGPIPQGRFLSALGIHQRTAQLGRHADMETALRLLAATRRLTATEAMGGLFKVLCVHHPDLNGLPGFDA